jgi:predicted alpha/beta hydrolase family esterase
VRYPLLPRPDTPRLDEWLGALQPLLAAMPGERVVLCHSLGCILWLQHARDAGPEHRARRVLLVAPPSPRAKLPGVAGFFPLAVTAAEVAAAAGSTRLVCSLGDPYCPECGDAIYGRPLGIETDVIDGAAHVNVDAGYGPWPAVRAWALTGAVPLS